MHQYVLIFFLLITQPASLSAQDCSAILRNAEAAYSAGNYKKALTELQYTETCDYKNDLIAHRQRLQQRIFDAIERQRIDAENARKNATEASDQAQKAQARSDSLFEVAEAERQRARAVLGVLDKLSVKNDSIQTILVKFHQREEYMRLKPELLGRWKRAEILIKGGYPGQARNLQREGCDLLKDVTNNPYLKTLKDSLQCDTFY